MENLQKVSPDKASLRPEVQAELKLVLAKDGGFVFDRPTGIAEVTAFYRAEAEVWLAQVKSR
jgi:hypothetical protein